MLYSSVYNIYALIGFKAPFTQITKSEMIIFLVFIINYMN